MQEHQNFPLPLPFPFTGVQDIWEAHSEKDILVKYYACCIINIWAFDLFCI
uniref:Uncharacterized protein n=1 Tax=Rhizophora mucronata TaxID=61149 RepID=A0A2P2J4Q9_RHIMU